MSLVPVLISALVLCGSVVVLGLVLRGLRDHQGTAVHPGPDDVTIRFPLSASGQKAPRAAPPHKVKGPAMDPDSSYEPVFSDTLLPGDRTTLDPPERAAPPPWSAVQPVTMPPAMSRTLDFASYAVPRWVFLLVAMGVGLAVTLAILILAVHHRSGKAHQGGPLQPPPETRQQAPARDQAQATKAPRVQEAEIEAPPARAPDRPRAAATAPRKKRSPPVQLSAAPAAPAAPAPAPKPQGTTALDRAGQVLADIDASLRRGEQARKQADTGRLIASRVGARSEEAADIRDAFAELTQHLDNLSAARSRAGKAYQTANQSRRPDEVRQAVVVMEQEAQKARKEAALAETRSWVIDVKVRKLQDKTGHAGGAAR